MTRSLLFLAVTLPLFSLSLLAQSTDKLEIFGGYAYFNGSYTAPGGFTPSNPSGWNASVTGKFNRWLGATGEISGYLQSNSIGDSAKTFNFLFGPRISVPLSRVTPFAHFLIGGSHVSSSGFQLLTSTNSFAFAVGGGMDVALSRHLAIRGEIDELHNGFTAFDNQLQPLIHNNLPRISTGIVLRF